MKKIFVTLSLICFVAFVSNAQTSPTTAKASTKEVKAETKDASATTSTEAKKSGCCHKNMSSAECKKAMKNCGDKAGTDAKAEKSKETGSKSN